MPAEGANHILAANGASLAGCTLHVKYRKPVYEVNFFGAQRFSVESGESLPMSQVNLIMNFT